MNKVFKVIFWLSFLPYVILLLISIFCAIVGYDEYTWILPVYKGTIYGWEAFSNTLIMNSIKCCVIPILPTVVIYQIVYILINKRKKYKKK